MYIVRKSKNGAELERFNKEETALKVKEYYLKYFKNACVTKE